MRRTPRVPIALPIREHAFVKSSARKGAVHLGVQKVDRLTAGGRLRHGRFEQGLEEAYHDIVVSFAASGGGADDTGGT